MSNSQVSYQERLQELYNKYFESTIKQRRLQLIEQNSTTIFANMRFENDQIKLNLLIDRGVTEIEISSLFGDELFIDLNKYVAWFYLSNNPFIKPNTEKWRKVIGMKLSAYDLSHFLNDNWDELTRLLNKNNFRNTTNEILTNLY